MLSLLKARYVLWWDVPDEIILSILEEHSASDVLAPRFEQDRVIRPYASGVGAILDKERLGRRSHRDEKMVAEFLAESPISLFSVERAAVALDETSGEP